MTEGNPEEPVTVTDKRRIDPETGEKRQDASGPAPSGPGSEAPADTPGSAPENAEANTANDQRVAELTDDLQRVQADFANYRKRAMREQQAATERAKGAVVGELLAILDDIDRARSHGDLEAGPLKAFADKLTDTLTSLGLAEFGAKDEDFDPALHEAVHHEGDGTGHSVIGEVLRKGYKLGESVLRHAMVGVVDTVKIADDSEAEASQGDVEPDTES